MIAAGAGPAHRSARPPETAPHREIDLRVYLITDSAQCASRGVSATVRAAIRGGVTAVQLRDPFASDEDVIRLGRTLSAELRGSDVPLVVDDRVDLVEPIGADGAHIGQSDLPADQARLLLGPDALLGLSVSTSSELAAAQEYADGTIDYLGVGPVWSTASKPGHASPIGIPGLSQIVTASPWPVVAIGGISLARIADIRGSGAQGVAVISAICSQDDPETATRELLESWQGAAT